MNAKIQTIDHRNPPVSKTAPGKPEPKKPDQFSRERPGVIGSLRSATKPEKKPEAAKK